MNRRTLESVAVGMLAAGVLTALGLLLVVVFGRARSLRLAAGSVVVATALAGVATRRLETVPFRVGATAVTAGALAAEVFSSNPGLGTVQLVAVGAGIITGMSGPRILKPFTVPLPRWVVVAGFLLVGAALVRIIIGGGGFGHDESAYMVKAGAWVNSTPATGWDFHRGIAQSVVAAAVLPFTRSEIAYRVISMLLTLGTVAGVGWLGRTVRTNRVGVLAAAIFAVSPSLLRRGAEFLTDIPSTGLLVVVTALMWRWCQRGNRWDLRWAAVFAATAFYVRYQAVLSLGLLAVTVLVLYWDRVSASIRQLIEAAAIVMVLLLPHFIWATLSVGAPWGVLLQTGEAGGRAYLGEGIVDYLSDFPDLLAGQAGAIAIIFALAWSGWKLASLLKVRRFGEDVRLAAFLVVPALGQFIILGLISHGEPRFMFYPVALLAVAGAAAADDLRRRVPQRLYRVAVVATSVALLAMLGVSTDRMDANAEARAASTEILIDVAAEASDGASCSVVTSYGPQITWYSGCRTATFSQFARNPDRLTQPAYVVLFENGKRQPVGPELDGLMAETSGEPIVLTDPADAIGDASLWRVGS